MSLVLKQLLSTLRTATGKKQSLASLIALWEILGGLSATLMVLHLFGSVDDSAPAKLLFGLALGGCVLSVVAGGALLGGFPAGRYLSLIVQGLQLTQFSFGWCLYDFVIGPMLQLGITNTGRFWGILAIAPHFSFQLNRSTAPFAAFNVFAFGACFYLLAISNEDLNRFRSEAAQPAMSGTSHPATSTDAMPSIDGDV